MSTAFGLFVLSFLLGAALGSSETQFLPVRLHLHGSAYDGFVGQGQPEFRWGLQCPTCKSVRQTRFHLKVVEAEGSQTVLDTGPLTSTLPQHTPTAVDYLNGLRSNTVYEVWLTVWGIAAGIDAELQGSTTTIFRTALLHADDWNDAQWISGGTSLRTEFILAPQKTISSAVTFVSGIGCYELLVNGQKVQKDVFLEPSWVTYPTHRVHYRAYDVGALLHKGAANAFALRTGMCKYGYLGQHCDGASGGGSANCRAIIFHAIIKYNDGSNVTVSSESESGKWLVTTDADPIRYSHLFHGEIYDARNEDSGWDKPGFLAGPAWSEAIPYKNAVSELGKLSFARHPPIAISESRAYANANCFNCLAAPIWVFDFLQNMAGFATITVDGLKAGDSIILKYAEVLTADGFAKMDFCNGLPGCNCEGNCANQTDMYISKGSVSGETFTPHFTYHGYRYIQVEGLPVGYTPKKDFITAHFVHTNVTSHGNVHFQNADLDILNKIQTMIRYTQLSNIHHHPEDCPQREKRGWMGDSQITSAEASLNFDMGTLYTSWLEAMLDSQNMGCIHSPVPANMSNLHHQCCDPQAPQFGCDYHGIRDNFSDSRGSLPDVTPYNRPYGGWPGDPSWAAAGAVLPRHLAVLGEATVTPELYGVAKGVVDFFNAHGDPDVGGVLSWGYYGDWLQLEGNLGASRPQATGFSHLLSLKFLVDLATKGNYTEDANEYAKILSRLKKAYHESYWLDDSKSYGPGQTANLLPLYMDIPPNEAYNSTVDAFVKSILVAGNLSKSGIIGSAYVLQTLVKVGRGDIALQMAKATTQPSWGYMVLKGPGTIWETWDDSTNSHNHPAYAASIGPYLYSLAGLRDQTVDYDSRRPDVSFAPDANTAFRVGRASVSLKRVAGDVLFAWQATEHRFEVNATIPHGEEADMLLPWPPRTNAAADWVITANAVPIFSKHFEKQGGPLLGAPDLRLLGVLHCSVSAKGVDLRIGSGEQYFAVDSAIAASTWTVV